MRRAKFLPLLVLLAACGAAQSASDHAPASSIDEALTIDPPPPSVASTLASPAPIVMGGAPRLFDVAETLGGSPPGLVADAPPFAAALAFVEPKPQPERHVLSPMPGRIDGCGPGMVRVEGEYCPLVLETCAEYHPDWIQNQGKPGVTDRCLRFQSPSRCLSQKRVKLSYCMDRFEYPGEAGAIPEVLVSWQDAGATCRAAGKRLCTESEWNFACEGPEIRPYAYGYDRDAKICNQDRDYRRPDLTRRMHHYEACKADPICAAELARLDQREPIGSREQCVSWAGVFDMNGNVNEWVARTDQKPPHRSGLKGGWWGPIRSRCRPMTTFHPEDDYGYEVGFRCCSDADDAAHSDAASSMTSSR